jgi:hypothetical protein
VGYVKRVAKRGARERERERTGCLEEHINKVGMRDKLFEVFRTLELISQEH